MSSLVGLLIKQCRHDLRSLVVTEKKHTETDALKSDWVFGESVGSWLRRRIGKLVGQQPSRKAVSSLMKLLPKDEDGKILISEATIRRYIKSKKYYIDSDSIRKKFEMTLGSYGYSNNYFNSYFISFGYDLNILKRFARFLNNNIFKYSQGNLSYKELLSIVNSYFYSKFTSKDQNFILSVLPVIDRFFRSSEKNFDLSLLRSEFDEELKSYFISAESDFCNGLEVLLDAVSIHKKLPEIMGSCFCRGLEGRINLKSEDCFFAEECEPGFKNEFDFLMRKYSSRLMHPSSFSSSSKIFYVASNAFKDFGAIRPLPRDDFSIQIYCCEDCFQEYKYDFVMPVAHIINKLEILYNMSQEDIAREVGIDQGYISKLLSGDIEFPKDKVVSELLKAIFSRYRALDRKSLDVKSEKVLNAQQRDLLRGSILRKINDIAKVCFPKLKGDEYSVTDGYLSEPYLTNSLVFKYYNDSYVSSRIDILFRSNVEHLTHASDVSIAVYITEFIPNFLRKDKKLEFYFSSAIANAEFFVVFYGDIKDFECFKIRENGYSKYNFDDAFMYALGFSLLSNLGCDEDEDFSFIL